MKQSPAIGWLIILAAAIAAVYAGVQDIAAGKLDIVPIGQAALFALLVIALTARSDRGNGNMQGCMTFLSLLYAPVCAFALLLLDFVATRSWLDPVLGWAGAFRLPVMLAGLVGPVMLVFTARVRMRRAKRWRGWMVVEIMLSAVMAGLVAGLCGLIWVGIGAGLRWAGL